jgi:hypothetical protein
VAPGQPSSTGATPKVDGSGARAPRLELVTIPLPFPSRCPANPLPSQAAGTGPPGGPHRILDSVEPGCVPRHSHASPRRDRYGCRPYVGRRGLPGHLTYSWGLGISRRDGGLRVGKSGCRPRTERNSHDASADRLGSSARGRSRSRPDVAGAPWRAPRSARSRLRNSLAETVTTPGEIRRFPRRAGVCTPKQRGNGGRGSRWRLS